ncbi:MAG TPA: hypothetical protein ENH29_05925 [Bacteroidetes bacterium]|nr:hypothetical protein [Bacteroidota bacterium]
MDAGGLLEIFLISAVSAVLAIRFFLQLTGYPQISSGGLHIAHMLWGGLLMLIAIVIALAFLSKASDQIAAILGGIGFGTFIDEVGKFVTADNDYFFKPTASLIYIIFILILLGVKAIQKYRKYSIREYLMNALRELEEVVSHDLDLEEKERALGYLAKCDQNEPLVRSLQELFEKIEMVPVPPPNRFSRTKFYFRDIYRRVVDTRAFSTLLVIFFIGQLTVKLLNAFFLVFLRGFGWTSLLNLHFIGSIGEKMLQLTWVDWGQLIFSFIGGVFVLTGVYYIPTSKLKAYKMFQRSILVSIFFSQWFTFYTEEFSAILGLFFNILIYLALYFLIRREEIESAKKCRESL